MPPSPTISRRWTRRNSTDAELVAKQMKTGPLDYFGKAAVIRQTGRVVYDLTVYGVEERPTGFGIPVGLLQTRSHRDGGRGIRAGCGWRLRPKMKSRLAWHENLPGENALLPRCSASEAVRSLMIASMKGLAQSVVGSTGIAALCKFHANAPRSSRACAPARPA